MNEHEQRFGGIERLYGPGSLARLAGLRLAVIGIGGVGTWAAEALARSGVGHLRLIDLDDVCITNVNRQLHALTSTVGRSKVDVMAERIRDINPQARVEAIQDFATADNLAQYLSADLHGVIDAVDGVAAKTAIIAHAKRQGLPLITAGAAGGQLDPARVQIADLSRTIQDPLLARVRADLRKKHGFPRDPKRKFGIEAVFSDEPLRYPNGCAAGGRIDCNSGYGAATFITGNFGFMAAGRLLQRLLDQASAR